MLYIMALYPLASFETFITMRRSPRGVCRVPCQAPEMSCSCGNAADAARRAVTMPAPSVLLVMNSLADSVGRCAHCFVSEDGPAFLKLPEVAKNFRLCQILSAIGEDENVPRARPGCFRLDGGFLFRNAARQVDGKGVAVEAAKFQRRSAEDAE